MLLVSLSFLLFSFPFISSNVINKLTNQELSLPWLETGFLLVDDKQWVTFSTKSNNFNNHSVVFISLPYIGGELYSEGFPITSRLTNITTTNGILTFSVKVLLFFSSCSSCSSYHQILT